jgi:hypothetical protein
VAFFDTGFPNGRTEAHNLMIEHVKRLRLRLPQPAPLPAPRALPLRMTHCPRQTNEPAAHQLRRATKSAGSPRPLRRPPRPGDASRRGARGP